jgi:hypothetical protein
MWDNLREEIEEEFEEHGQRSLWDRISDMLEASWSLDTLRRREARRAERNSFPMKPCGWCKKGFVARANGKFCSNRCKQKDKYARKKGLR